MEIQNNKNMDLEVLLSLAPCEAEKFLNEFLEDETSQLKAPHYMKKEILEKCQKPHIELKTKLCTRNWHANSKKLQLFCYSLRVGVAVVFALFFLFSIPPNEVSGQNACQDRTAGKIQLFLEEFPNTVQEWVNHLSSPGNMADSASESTTAQ